GRQVNRRIAHRCPLQNLVGGDVAAMRSERLEHNQTLWRHPQALMAQALHIRRLRPRKRLSGVHWLSPYFHPIRLPARTCTNLRDGLCGVIRLTAAPRYMPRYRNPPDSGMLFSVWAEFKQGASDLTAPAPVVSAALHRNAPP